MDEGYLSELRKKAKDNTWQVLTSLKENIEGYIYFKGVFNREKAQEVDKFIIYLIDITKNIDYLPYFKEIIDKYADLIIPEIIKCSQNERPELILSLSIETRSSLFQKLKDKIPVEDLKQLWNCHFDDLLFKTDVNDLGKEKNLLYEERINEKLKEIVEESKKSINDFGEEIIAGYEKEISDWQKIMDLDKSCMDKNKVPEYIIDQIRKYKNEREGKVIVDKHIKLMSLKDKKGKRISRKSLEEILKGVDKGQINQILSKKPDMKTPKETVKYERDISEVTAKKGINIEEMSIPEEKAVLSEMNERPFVSESLEEETVVKESIIMDQKAEKEEKETEIKKSAHYDQSEAIKRIKEQQKGKSSIDSKVE